MNFDTLAAPAAGLGRVAADALVVVLAGEAGRSGLDRTLDACLSGVLADGELALKPGRSLLLHRAPKVAATRLVWAVAADGSARAFHKAVAAALALLKPGGSAHVAVSLCGAEASADHAHALALAAADAAYLYRHTKPSAPAAPKLARISFVCASSAQPALDAALARGAHLAEGVSLARECANRPANHCTPTFLGQEARRLGREFGLKVEVLGRREIEKLGMGSFLAVAQGSEEPMKFIVMQYQGAPRKQAPVVLVGKGITFDTGGISLKPAPEMDEMKFDMGGAASVLGTMRAVAGMKARVNLIGLIAACENMPSGRAIKPGDVVRSMSGQTIEILNTDAEGRLILCDALTYAERFKPAAVVDIATLTGACVIALGHHRSGMWSTDDTLATELQRAGDAALDPCWRMPLDEEYEDALKSNFADVANVGGRPGGSITAALFLKRFATRFPWAHLDIAGTAWKSGAAKGGTGRPVPLLTRFVLGRADAGA
ncbi:MAG: leucyl aminopeptidase [Rubrivivax sp.]